MRSTYGKYKVRGKKGLVWYFWYYDASGERVRKSTGMLAKYNDAEEVDRWIANFLTPPEPKYLLSEFCTDFFVWGRCQWIERQHLQGHGFSEPVASGRRAHLVNYILPAFGARELKTIEAGDISDWIMSLSQLSNQTRNHILYSFRIILDEAVFRKRIQRNPLKDIKPFADKHKARDILALDEIRTLFPVDELELVRIWQSWYWITFFYLMLTSGVRSGEARALRWRHVIWTESALVVLEAVKGNGKIGETKTGEARAVILPTRTITFLRHFRDLTPYPKDDELIFPAFRSRGDQPLNKKIPLKSFYDGLDRAGVDRSGRNIVLHSLRHTYNSRMRLFFGDEIIRKLTGHKTEAMTDRYDHSTPLDKLRGLIADTSKINEAWPD